MGNRTAKKFYRAASEHVKDKNMFSQGKIHLIEPSAPMYGVARAQTAEPEVLYERHSHRTGKQQGTADAPAMPGTVARPRTRRHRHGSDGSARDPRRSSPSSRVRSRRARL